MRLTSSLVLIATLASAAWAQPRPRPDSAKKPKDGTDLPLETTRTLSFTTTEGTWMSLDVSPDGKMIVFDLVGDLYTMPITGGQATRITSGPGFDSQPRWSPDGKLILFTSDRSGTENLWLCNADGSKPRAVTKDKQSQHISAEWTPDGKYIVDSRTNASIRASSYDIYLYSKDGGGGLKLTGTGSTAAPAASPFSQVPNNYLGAAFGPDSRWIWMSAKTGGFGYNLVLPTWQLYVYDRETGKVFPRTSEWGSGMRPTLSPDGKWLVYGSRRDTSTALRLRELATGDERWLAQAVQRDDQESRYTRDVLPGMSFTPDSKALIISANGKFWRYEVPGGQRTEIPFSADVNVPMAPAVHFDFHVNDSTLVVQQIRGARPSPDGRRIAFTALDHLWMMDLPTTVATGTPAAGTTGGAAAATLTPRRLTDVAGVGEHSPVWSPDGRWIAFVTWTDSGGHIWRVSSDGKGRPERLTREAAFYQNLNYTPDGSRLVVERSPRQEHLEHDEPAQSRATGIELMSMSANGGALTLVSPLNDATFPHFIKGDPSRVYIYDGIEGLLSMRMDGTDRRPIVKVTGYTPPGSPNAQPNRADELLASPDGDRVLALVDNNVYLITIPFANGGVTPTVNVSSPAAAAVPVKRLTKVGGDFIGWMPDGKRIFYSLGHSYFTYDLARADSLVRDSTEKADSIKNAAPAAKDSAQKVATDSAKTPADSAKKKTAPAYEAVRLDVRIVTPKDRPTGMVALRNARVISMRGDEVLDRGDILIRGNRIMAVGPAGSVSIPADAKSYDLTGKTILPGWVDIHAHMWPQWGIHRQQIWQYLAQLSYGVTSSRDPQTATTDVLSYADLVETGDITGPRIFSTGPGVFWSEDISSLDDARDVLRRYSEFYNTGTIKQYGAGDRKVRQWVIMAAKELGLMPTSEGYLDFKKNLTEALDGYPGAEHSYPITPLMNDALQVFSKSGIINTPTLLVSYGGPFGENYWFEHYNIHDDPKLNRFWPHEEMDAIALRRGFWARDEQYNFPRIAASSAKLLAAGGKVGLGGHGELQGLGVHFELWSFAMGGVAPMDIIRIGTIMGAEGIGMGKELGSLEAGKLADLQVLDANPLENIRNTNTIRYVMKNGRLYDANTMAEIWPRQRDIGRPWWWR